MSGEVWTLVYDRLAAAGERASHDAGLRQHAPLAERLARHLSERLGEEHVTAHHGSMAKEQRLDAEQRLKRGELQGAGGHRLAGAGHRHRRCGSGVPDRLAALDHPPSCSASGARATAVGGTPKGRLFPLSRDDLVECTALLTACGAASSIGCTMPDAAARCPRAADRRRGRLPRMGRERRSTSWCAARCPFRAAARAQDFDAVVRMLGEGFTTRRGRRGALIHHDAVNHRCAAAAARA